MMLRLPPEAIDAARGEAWGARRREYPSVPQFMPHVGPIADWEKRLIEVGAEAQLNHAMEKVREFLLEERCLAVFDTDLAVIENIIRGFDSWLSHEGVK